MKTKYIAGWYQIVFTNQTAMTLWLTAAEAKVLFIRMGDLQIESIQLDQ